MLPVTIWGILENVPTFGAHGAFEASQPPSPIPETDPNPVPDASDS